MSLEWQPVLKDVISEVLETMFFSIVDFTEGECGTADFDYATQISLINHESRLEILVQFKNDFARTITANLLGIDEEEVSEDDLQDSLRELANMVGGGYHARILSKHWQLGIPLAWKTEPIEGKSGNSITGLILECFGEALGSAVVKQQLH